jgi:hypothetical protein
MYKKEFALKKGIILILIIFTTSLISCSKTENSDNNSSSNTTNTNDNTDIGYGEPVKLFEKVISELGELSGIASSKLNKDLVWAHNDFSSNGKIFAIDKSGDIKITANINNLEDIEDMCIGNYDNEEYIFIGDFGDNSEKRDSCTISMLKEPTLDSDNIETPIDFNFVYSDGKAHNCESLGYSSFVSGGSLYLFTKEKNIRVFKLVVSELDENEENVAEFIGKLEIENFEKPSAADISRDGLYLIIRDENNIFKLSVENPEDFDKIIEKNALSINCPSEPNGEAISIDPYTEFLYTSSEEQPKSLYEISIN